MTGGGRVESRGLSVELTILTSTVSVHSQHNSLNTFINLQLCNDTKALRCIFCLSEADLVLKSFLFT